MKKISGTKIRQPNREADGIDSFHSLMILLKLNENCLMWFLVVSFSRSKCTCAVIICKGSFIYWAKWKSSGRLLLRILCAGYGLHLGRVTWYLWLVKLKREHSTINGTIAKRAQRVLQDAINFYDSKKANTFEFIWIGSVLSARKTSLRQSKQDRYSCCLCSYKCSKELILRLLLFIVIKQ